MSHVGEMRNLWTCLSWQTWQADGSTGQVTNQGALVTIMSYELLDPSNILTLFGEESGGEEPDASVFHITKHAGSLLEMLLYVPGDENANSSSGQQGQAVSGAHYCLTFQKL